MNNEKYNQLIDEAYQNYMYNWPKKIPRIGPCLKEEFINQCKTDDEFAKTWGLKIEERELKLEERLELFINENHGSHPEDIEVMDDYDTPTKLIRITYNNEKIELYDN